MTETITLIIRCAVCDKTDDVEVALPDGWVYKSLSFEGDEPMLCPEHAGIMPFLKVCRECAHVFGNCPLSRKTLNDGSDLLFLHTEMLRHGVCPFRSGEFTAQVVRTGLGYQVVGMSMTKENKSEAGELLADAILAHRARWFPDWTPQDAD